MDVDKEYYEWTFLESSTIQSERLSIGDNFAVNYIGMTIPKKINDKKYELRITIKYIFPFTNGILRVNSITNLILKTTVPVLWTAQDGNSVETLTIGLKEIEKETDEYIKRMPDLIGRKKHVQFSDSKKMALILLNTRFELEN